MKTSNVRTTILFVSVMLISNACKKDDPAPVSTALSAATILGTWKITAAEGTEWGKDTPTGTATITTPRATDSGTVGITITFTGTQATVTKGGSPTILPYTLDVANSTILIGADGNTGLGFYTIKEFVSGSGMKMDQRVPIAADFNTTPSGGGKYLAFQKFWTLTKQ